MGNDYERIKHHAMMVLENIEIGKWKGGIEEFKFKQNVPSHIVNFLENNELVFFKETEGDSIINNRVVLTTEKGEKELEEYFKKINEA